MNDCLSFEIDFIIFKKSNKVDYELEMILVFYLSEKRIYYRINIL